LNRLGEYTVGGDKVAVARNWLAKLEGYHFRDPRGSHTFRNLKSVARGEKTLGVIRKLCSHIIRKLSSHRI
jgi:hypothetical protein